MMNFLAQQIFYRTNRLKSYKVSKKLVFFRKNRRFFDYKTSNAYKKKILLTIF